MDEDKHCQSQRLTMAHSGRELGHLLPELVGQGELDPVAKISPAYSHADTQTPHRQLLTMLHLVVVPRPGRVALMRMP